jgi:hypothetical protein
VISDLTDEFLECFGRLPSKIREQARKNYGLWKANPSHPGLDFKRVGKKSPIYSVRVGIGWRALGLVEDDAILRFRIGSHAVYDRLLKKM